MSELSAFLSNVGLGKYSDELADCGMELLADLADLEFDDLVSLGLDEPDAAKLCAALGKSASPHPVAAHTSPSPQQPAVVAYSNNFHPDITDAEQQQQPQPVAAAAPTAIFDSVAAASAAADDDDDDDDDDDELSVEQQRAVLLEGMMAARSERELMAEDQNQESAVAVEASAEQASGEAASASSGGVGSGADACSSGFGGSGRGNGRAGRRVSEPVLGVSALPAALLMQIGGGARKEEEEGGGGGGGASAKGAAAAYEAHVQAQTDGGRPKGTVGRRRAAKQKEQSQPEIPRLYADGDYVLTGPKELGQVEKFLPDGATRVMLQDGTTKWRQQSELIPVYGSSSTPKAELEVHDWVRIKPSKDAAGGQGDAQPKVGQLLQIQAGLRAQVRLVDGHSMWREVSELVPPCDDAPSTGLVIGPNGEMLLPDYKEAVAEEIEAEKREEAANEKISAHMGAMQAMRRAMSSMDGLSDDSDAEYDESYVPENRYELPVYRASEADPRASEAGPKAGSAAAGMWGRAGKKVVLQQRVAKAFDPGAYQRTKQRGADLPAAIATAADAPALGALSQLPPPVSSGRAVPCGIPPPPTGLVARVPSKVLAPPNVAAAGGRGAALRPAQLPPPPAGVGRVPSKIMQAPRLTAAHMPPPPAGLLARVPSKIRAPPPLPAASSVPPSSSSASKAQVQPRKFNRRPAQLQQQPQPQPPQPQQPPPADLAAPPPPLSASNGAPPPLSATTSLRQTANGHHRHFHRGGSVVMPTITHGVGAVYSAELGGGGGGGVDVALPPPPPPPPPPPSQLRPQGSSAWAVADDDGELSGSDSEDGDDGGGGGASNGAGHAVSSNLDHTVAVDLDGMRPPRPSCPPPPRERPPPPLPPPPPPSQLVAYDSNAWSDHEALSGSESDEYEGDDGDEPAGLSDSDDDDGGGGGGGGGGNANVNGAVPPAGGNRAARGGVVLGVAHGQPPPPSGPPPLLSGFSPPPLLSGQAAGKASQPPSYLPTTVRAQPLISSLEAEIEQPLDTEAAGASKRGAGKGIGRVFGHARQPDLSHGTSLKFGAPLYECAMGMSYNCQVPRPLIELWKAIVASPRGLSTEGIFRITPSAAECHTVEKELTSGKGVLSPTANYAPEVLAHLIKSFLRRLPAPGLLGSIEIETIADCTSAAGCQSVLGAMRPLERALLEWLIRVILEVHDRAESNKMRLKNLSVVFAPNLWLIPLDMAMWPGKDPREELRNVELVEQALHTLCTVAARSSKVWTERRGVAAPVAARNPASVHLDQPRAKSKKALYGDL